MNRRWAENNPEKREASRRKPGLHTLLERKGASGVCVICGSVEAVPWGRGWTCGTRAKELRGSQQAAPQTRCVDCQVWLKSGEGPERCPPCHSLNSPGQTWDGWAASKRRAPLDSVLATDLLDQEWALWRARDLSSSLGNTRPLVKVLGDRNVPPEWEWALRKNADWSSFDEEASKVAVNERTDNVSDHLIADINGEPWGAVDGPVTLPELYRAYHERGETFPEFKARALSKVSPEELLLIQVMRPEHEYSRMTDYPGYDDPIEEENYSLPD
jgi:hypothetical protein